MAYYEEYTKNPYKSVLKTTRKRSKYENSQKWKTK